MKDNIQHGSPSGRPSKFCEFLTDISRRMLGLSRRARSENVLLQRAADMPQVIGLNIENGIRGKESVIVIVGPIAAGKGTAAGLLIQQDYVPFNYGDVIFQERTARGLPEERKISNAVGADLRLQFGNDIIARRIVESIQLFRDQGLGQKILIDGLRHPDEVAWVKENLGARVIGITASPEVRYQRTLRRNREVDPKSLQGFNEVDQEDRGLTSNDHGNQTDACLCLADIIIENSDENLEDFKRKFYEIFKSLDI